MLSEPGASPGAPPGSPTPVSPDAIRQQLGKILASPEFQASVLLRDFLGFIVEGTLNGQAHEIKAYTVAVQVLGRNANFDASRDPIVRILAGRLRRGLERYYLTQGRDDAVRIEIPKGTYVPTFQAVLGAQPPALPDPALTLAPGPAVAVMPFLNLTGDHRQEFFADGLAEELVSELARYQDLTVIAFHSTRHWKGKDHDVREVGRDLKARFLVEGSIRKAARNLKIAISVVDAQNGLQLWGEQYCRELRAANLIALQEEIARQVVAKIGSEYGIISRTLSRESRGKPPESLETYEASLRYYQYITVFTLETFEETLRFLEHAVNREPECGLPWALLANLYAHKYSLMFSPSQATLEKAQQYARKGAALEPHNQMARATLAYLHLLGNNREALVQEAERALTLNPNSPALVGFLGWLLALYGEWERGLAIQAKSQELNPHYPGWFHLAPFFHLFLKERFEEAYEEARAFQMPQLFWDPLLRAAALGRLGRTAEGAQAVAELLEIRPDFLTQGRFLIGCYAKFPHLVEGLLDGLRQAGLQV